MKRIAVLTLFAALVLLALSCGCTENAPATPPVTTIPPTPAATPEPTPTPDPFPDALPLNTVVPYGTGTKTGDLTITGYKVRPTYSWVDPSWNSPREQLDASNPLETQEGYNAQKPQDGNTFLFVYVTVASTGTDAVWAPSPAQIAVISKGTTYQYSTLASGETIVDGETGEQYDFLIGEGGSGGYVQPGQSNIVKGFLIYEVPAPFSPETTYVVANVDAQTQGIWKLA
jgi:hypothetical protein